MNQPRFHSVIINFTHIKSLLSELQPPVDLQMFCKNVLIFFATRRKEINVKILQSPESKEQFVCTLSINCLRVSPVQRVINYTFFPQITRKYRNICETGLHWCHYWVKCKYLFEIHLHCCLSNPINIFDLSFSLALCEYNKSQFA